MDVFISYYGNLSRIIIHIIHGSVYVISRMKTLFIFTFANIIPYIYEPTEE